VSIASLLLLAGAWLVAPGLGIAAATYIPTNIDLTVRAAEEAVAECLAGLDSLHSETDWELPVLVTAQSEHDANWVVEHCLTGELLERNFTVAVDTSAAAPESPRLSYRIVDLSLSGWSGLRGGEVWRRCRITLGLRLVSGGELVWQHEATSQIRDSIPKNRLEVLENATYDFADLELEERNWGRFVEPAIVSSVLGTLVYLFFSNR
jgi:hypothetical protein